jgi:two-component system, LytTR family, sensor kinase
MAATRPRWPIIVAIWTLPALADVVDTYVSTVMRGVVPQVARIALLVAPGWYAWAAMTPAILWLARHYPLRRPLRAKAIWIHLGACVAATLVHAGVIWIAGRLVDPGQQVASGRLTYGETLSNWAPVSMFVYWAVVVAGHAYESMRRASALSEELARAQLAALRAQLHPHFLFNALNTAVSLVRVGKPDEGVRVLMNLSDLLRHVLRDLSAHEVPLRDELALLERYVDIERARFANGLAVEFTIDDQLLDALVPALILQPLVENAIRHGVAMREEATTVAVEASATGSMLALHVRDDGPGLPRDWDPERSSGVGLRNTRARLAGLYGSAAALCVSGGKHGGVDAKVTLPLRFAGDGEQRRV